MIIQWDTFWKIVLSQVEHILVDCPEPSWIYIYSSRLVKLAHMNR